MNILSRLFVANKFEGVAKISDQNSNKSEGYVGFSNHFGNISFIQNSISMFLFFNRQ